MALTYTALATVTVGSGGAADIQFTNIPNTYTDLAISTSFRCLGTGYGTDVLMTINGVYGTNFSAKRMYGYDGTVYNDGGTGTGYAGVTNRAGSTASTFASNFIYIANYTSSNNKPISIDGVIENNSSVQYLPILIAQVWANSATISSVSMSSATDFVQYSTATLYGIKNTV